MVKLTTILFILLFSSLLSSFINARLAGAEKNAGRKLGGENPFTAKAALIRYWKTQISNDLPEPWFFLNKASPLDVVDLATFSKLADQNSLSTHLHNFCSKANLLCRPGSPDSFDNDQDFPTYNVPTNFSVYGNNSRGGEDSFGTYTNDNETDRVQNIFDQYSANSTRHYHTFKSYAYHFHNETDQSFGSYSKSAVGGEGSFTNYQNSSTPVNLKFTSYDDDSNGTAQTFKRYSNDAGNGEQDFSSYDQKATLPGSDFDTYASRSGHIVSKFTHYGDGQKNGTNTADNFNSYGEGAGEPKNQFSTYLEEGHGLADFKTYVSDNGFNDFKSYAWNGTAVVGSFHNYDPEGTFGGPVTFTSYAEEQNSETTGSLDFNTYGVGIDKDHNFKRYGENSTLNITFNNYQNGATKRWVVEPGKFFREKLLKPGTVMPMPDIKDKMPQRSFLPPTIAAKLPFSSGEIHRLREIFHASENSGMAQMIGNALNECERAPSPGETKQCVGSGEEMIDFAKSVLGSNIAVRTTENTRGSNGDILIGAVKAINGGEVTKSVSCHQSLYPSLLYYCHSVPKVRVYEADILDPNSKAKINHGVAICHVDTSSWSAGHAAFLALGPGPGKIEVCHWIFENDLSWAIADLSSDI